VRDGELDVRVGVSGRDEIAVLADSFNQMVDRLAVNTAGLKQARRGGVPGTSSGTGVRPYAPRISAINP
jgi:hypothetical protein